MYQSGVWTTHSTNLCLAHLIVFVFYLAWTQRCIPAWFLVDLENVFDALDYEVLLEKISW